MDQRADTEHREGDYMMLDTEHTYSDIVYLREDEFYKILECLDELEQLKRRQYRDVQNFNNSLREFYIKKEETQQG